MIRTSILNNINNFYKKNYIKVTYIEIESICNENGDFFNYKIRITNQKTKKYMYFNIQRNILFNNRKIDQKELLSIFIDFVIHYLLFINLKNSDIVETIQKIYNIRDQNNIEIKKNEFYTHYQKINILFQYSEIMNLYNDFYQLKEKIHDIY